MSSSRRQAPRLLIVFLGSTLAFSAGVALALWRSRTTFACPGCNLLLISIDTLRADHLGAYGYSRDTSPNIDALAKRSLVFEQAMSSAPWTIPSHLAILTGREPTAVIPHTMATGATRSPGWRRFRKFFYRQYQRLPNVAGILRGRGYAAGAFTGGGFMSPLFGWSKGFGNYRSLKRPRDPRPGAIRVAE